MINTLLNNIRVAKVNCYNEEKTTGGAMKGFSVYLEANKGYDFSMTDYQDPDEEDHPRTFIFFYGNTIDEALRKASAFLDTLKV